MLGSVHHAHVPQLVQKLVPENIVRAPETPKFYFWREICTFVSYVRIKEELQAQSGDPSV